MPIFVFIFLMSISFSFAQPIIVGERVQRVKPASDSEIKSLPAAVALSALLPGSGEAYLGNSSRQKIFLTSEIFFLSVTGVTYLLKEHYYNSSYAYAARYAGARNNEFTIDYLEAMERFRSRSGVDGQNNNPSEYDSYDLYQIRNGSSVSGEFPLTPEYSWDWGTSDDPENTRHWNRYSELLDNYRRSVVVLKASIGALVLNRVISMVSVIQYFKSNSQMNVQAAPFIADDRPGVVVMVGF